MATDTTQVINQVSNVQSNDIRNADPAIMAQVESLANQLNKNNESLRIQTGTGVKSFFGLASSCCN